MRVEALQVSAASKQIVGHAVPIEIAPDMSLLDAIAYLSQLQVSIWQSLRTLPEGTGLCPDGTSYAAIRVRRSRQAAALQSAMHVLVEMAREQRLEIPTAILR